MSHTVTKNRAHDVADLDFGASCQWLLFIVGGIADQTVQPVLNRYRLDVARAVTTPARSYPLAQIAFVAVLGRVRLLIVVVHPHFSFAVVFNQRLEARNRGTACLNDLPVHISSKNLDVLKCFCPGLNCGNSSHHKVG
jgi:hypothetical protein